MMTLVIPSPGTQFFRPPTFMAVRDHEWPAYTQWFCCRICQRLWTYQGSEVVMLDKQSALGPAIPSPGVPERTCAFCEGETPLPLIEI